MRLTTKQTLLWIVSSFIVTITRHLLQYGYFPWHKSIFTFFVSWFLGLIGLGFVAALVAGSIGYFIKQDKQSDDNVLLTSFTFTCLVLAIVSLVILFLYFSAGGVTELDYE